MRDKPEMPEVAKKFFDIMAEHSCSFYSCREHKMQGIDRTSCPKCLEADHEHGTREGLNLAAEVVENMTGIRSDVRRVIIKKLEEKMEE